MFTWLKRRFARSPFRPTPRRQGLWMETLEDRCTPATLTVENTLDAGAGSLRQMIQNANSASFPGADVIQFNIPADDAGHVYYRDDGIAGKVTEANVTVTSATDDSTIGDIDPDYRHSFFRIKPASALPTISGAVTIDGYTQGSSTPLAANMNTLANGNNAVLRIDLAGSLAGGPFVHALNITAGSSTVRGLAIHSFTGHAINLVTKDGNVVEGNFLGTSVAGLTALYNRMGVHIQNSTGPILVGNRVGTNADGVNDPGERNLISGNNWGVHITNFPSVIVPEYYNVVAGNFIGTDRTGTVTDPDGIPDNGDELGNENGVYIPQSSRNLIGGTTAAARNIISGNGQGVAILGNGHAESNFAFGNVIQGNFIGTDVTGTRDLGNRAGVNLGGNGNLLGGTVPGARNIISGNASGVGVGEGANFIYGNYIGTDVTGTLPLGNTHPTPNFSFPQAFNGIVVTGIGHKIGGIGPGEGNIIANSTGAGVRVLSNSSSPVGSQGHSVRGNSIYNNGQLGIDHALFLVNAHLGVTPNDLGDADVGPNHYQNFPLIASAASNAGGTTITGSLNSTALTTFALDFYANAVADPSGHGEGQFYLGSANVTTDANGDVSFNVTVAGVAAVGHRVSATATAPDGSTSEFSAVRSVVSANSAPINLVLNSGAIFENDTFTLTGSFDDADALDKHTVTVDWGEGSPDVYVLPVGQRSFSFTHQYRDDNPTATGSDDYPVVVTLSDGLAAATAKANVRVTNIAPSNLTWKIDDADVSEGEATSVSGTFSDPGSQDVHTVTINWGDGAPISYTLAAGTRSFTISHVYADDNPTATPSDRYTVGVSLVDDDGGLASLAPSAIYGLKSQGGATSNPPTALYSFNSDGTGFTDIGRVEINATPIDADALAFSPTIGMFAYQMLEPDSQLVAVNPTTAVATPVGTALVGREIRGAAFDSADRLWVLDATNNALLEINPINGQVIGSPVGLTRNGNPHDLSTASDLAARNDGTLVVVDFTNGTILYSLDPVTGALTLLHSDSVPQSDGTRVASAGLAFPSLHANELFTYDVNNREDIYRYDVAAGFQRSVFFAHIIPSFNAGRGDLAAAAGNNRLTVRNVDPVIDTMSATPLAAFGMVRLAGLFHEVGAQDTHTLTISWGDASTQTVNVSGGAFSIDHQYLSAGSYTIGVTLIDDDTGMATRQVNVIVANAAPTLTFDPVAPINEGGTAVLTGKISDPGTLDTFTLTVNWGDPSSPNNIETYTFGPSATGSQSFSLTHQYVGAQIVGTSATYTISAGIVDNHGGKGSAGTPVIVNNLVDFAGRMFDDRDNDGVYEPGNGEVGIGGVAVQLYDQTSGSLVAARTTAGDGTYSFDVDLGAGTYKIVAGLPAGSLDGKETAGNLGGTVDNARDSREIIGIVVGAAGTTNDAVDYGFASFQPSRLQGMAWEDFNNDGDINFGEKAIVGVVIALTGIDDRGNAVSLPASTDSQGIYEFLNLRPGQYKLAETQPAGFADGIDVLGMVNGSTSGSASINDQFSQIVLPAPGADGVNYNFGERPLANGQVRPGQTATIGYWQNKNGQALLKSLNGGANSEQLGNWLATTFPNMYGPTAGIHNLTGKTNTEVAAYYVERFKQTAKSSPGGPPKLEAQVLATAFAVYVTNQNLAGTTASAYGFQVTASGVGYSTFNVGANGAAFGVANNNNVTVIDLLLAVNARSRNGLLFDADGTGSLSNTELSGRVMANDVFSGINEAGDI